jgi:UDP-2,4-diacetamido-2,4,6-trideoxy-beta-L-altropyranose hydrolase
MIRTASFRVDAGGEIGAGHFMRCLTLASRLRELGWQTEFASRQVPEPLAAAAVGQGHRIVRLQAKGTGTAARDLAHSAWLHVSQEDDATEMLGLLEPNAPGWVVVDHYALDGRWEQMIAASGRSILVIDDLADRAHECSILLDQNLFTRAAERYDPRLRTETVRLLGPEYALLRPQFALMRTQASVRSAPIRRIMVLFGGSDLANHTEKAIRALQTLSRPVEVVDVVISAHHPVRGGIEALCAENGFRCHVQSNAIAELMVGADLAIGAGGSTSWERCCVGLPSICLTQADNQVPIARELAQRGVIIDLGDGEHVTPDLIAAAVERLMDRPQLLGQMSELAFQLVDGLGAKRVAQRVLDLS